MNLRELDAKVAECLGWTVLGIDDDYDDIAVRRTDGKITESPKFSRDWGALGVLIKEASTKGLLISIEPIRTFTLDYNTARSYYKMEYKATVKSDVPGGYGERVLTTIYEDNAPYAACIAFLCANDADVTPYLEEVTAD